MRSGKKKPARSFVLDIQLQPKQRELLDLALHSPYSWLSCGGSKGGAKSGGLRRVLLTLLMTYPGSKALLMRKHWDEVFRNHLLKLLEEFPVLESMFNKSDKIVSLPNGSQLQFGYAENEGDCRKFNGQELDFIAVDQSEEFSLSDLNLLKSCNRSIRPGLKAKMILTFNPGGPGHAYNKRLFVDRQFEANETPEDYAPLLVMYPWSNVEWCRADLQAAGYTADDYYHKFTEAERKKWFLNSDYGKSLLGLDDDLRAKYLYGEWNITAGQYFGKSFKCRPYYEPKPDEKHDRSPGNIWGANSWPVVTKPWFPRWISMDYGYADNSAAHWWFWDGTRTYIEREWVFKELETDEIARGIFARSEGHRFSDFVLSHDCFLRTSSPVSRADQMALVIRELNKESERKAKLTPGSRVTYVPVPRQAPKDRVNRNSLLSQMLTNCTLLINENCSGLIRKLPLAIRDPKNDGDYIGFDAREGSGGGDDELDSAGYGITVIPSQLRVPKEVELESRITATEPNHKAMQVLQVQADMRRQGLGRTFSARAARRYA